jgi:hypothetical protein
VAYDHCPRQPQTLGHAACVSPDCPSCNHTNRKSLSVASFSSFASGDVWHQPSISSTQLWLVYEIKSFAVSNNNDIICFCYVSCVFQSFYESRAWKSWRGDLIIILHFWYPGMSFADVEAPICLCYGAITVQVWLGSFHYPAMHRMFEFTGPCV